MREPHMPDWIPAGRTVFASVLLMTSMLVGCTTAPEAIPSAGHDPVETTTLVVEVETPKWEGEMLYIAVYQSADSFLEVDQWVQGVTVPVTCPITRLVFEDVPAVPTAVSGFIDIKRDETLTRNIIGLPVEPWGFSNDISILLSRPKFESARFEVDRPETQVRFAMGTTLDRSEIRGARTRVAEESDLGEELP